MMSRDVSGHVPKRSQQTETRAKVGNSVSSRIALPTPSVRHTGVMLGEYLTALLIAVLGYVYPAYLCFKVRSVPSAIPTPPSPDLKDYRFDLIRFLPPALADPPSPRRLRNTNASPRRYAGGVFIGP